MAEAAEALAAKTSELLSLTSEETPNSPAELWTEHGRIRSLLEEIQQLQTGPGLFPEGWDRSEALSPFLAWARDHGIQADSVEIVAERELGEAQFGLAVKAELTVGDIAVRVPRRAMLSWEGAAESKALKAGIAKDPLLSGMENVALAISLLHEALRGSDSPFQEYIRFLPASYPHCPLFFSPGELESLRGSPVFAASLRLFRSVARQFAYFHQRTTAADQVNPLLKTSLTPANLSFPAYRWAVATVSSRINYIPSKEEGRPAKPALIPLLDLANHDPSSLPPDFRDEAAVLLSATNLAAGARLCISYGRRSNSDFLLHSGFVPKALNPHDAMQLRLGLAKNDPVLHLRREIMAKLGLPEVCDFQLRRIRPIVEEACLCWIRAFVVSEPVLSIAAAAPDPRALLAADVVTERKAWEFLAARCDLLQRGYRGSQTSPATPAPVRYLLHAEIRLLAGTADYARAKIQALDDLPATDKADTA